MTFHYNYINISFICSCVILLLLLCCYHILSRLPCCGRDKTSHRIKSNWKSRIVAWMVIWWSLLPNSGRGGMNQTIRAAWLDHVLASYFLFPNAVEEVNWTESNKMLPYSGRGCELNETNEIVKAALHQHVGMVFTSATIHWKQQEIKCNQTRRCHTRSTTLEEDANWITSCILDIFVARAMGSFKKN